MSTFHDKAEEDQINTSFQNFFHWYFFKWFLSITALLCIFNGTIFEHRETGYMSHVYITHIWCFILKITKTPPLMQVMQLGVCGLSKRREAGDCSRKPLHGRQSDNHICNGTNGDALFSPDIFHLPPSVSEELLSHSRRDDTSYPKQLPF